VNRVSVHLVAPFSDRELSGFRRDELQDLLHLKVNKDGLSFSVVDHLRWDLKQSFDMAVAEGQVVRNPALLLFTPKEAGSPGHDDKGGATMFWRSRTEGAFDRETRDIGWHASW
jgi:hypothetical protein